MAVSRSFLALALCYVLHYASRAFAQCLPTSGAAFAFPPVAAPGLSTHLIFNNLSLPRGLAFDAKGALLVIEQNAGLSALVQRNDSVCVGWERTVVLNDTALTHGIQVSGNELYVSSETQVLLYKYDADTLSVVGGPKVVVGGMPDDGELTTHTLLLTPSQGSSPRSILVGGGPLSNIDFTAQIPSNGRSQVRRFPLPASPLTTPSAFPPGGFNWTSGELIAFGIRNPAGLALGPTQPNFLWVGENGASLDAVVGANASTNTPADELELVDLASKTSNKFYGFPFCHTGFQDLPPPFDVTFPGEQFSINATTPGINNTFCRNPNNNVPPRVMFQPHSVPLDVKFYQPGPSASGTGFPVTWKNDAFVSFHGSFNRVPPTGYGVVHVPFTGNQPTAGPLNPMGYSFIVSVPDLNVCPSQCIRPAGLVFDAHGRLFVSSDSTGEVFFVQRGP